MPMEIFARAHGFGSAREKKGRLHGSMSAESSNLGCASAAPSLGDVNCLAAIAPSDGERCEACVASQCARDASTA